ncbi:LacI family DNA-binding transcriptional regulator [Granulicoccus sp. GXG6511]|uniref:LacI family DNA-binding transcriptional regulator n=1 Tax=Granulicoccus sp. GXG6511 TaxID=3381351 RepID=UPI003D7CE4AB
MTDDAPARPGPIPRSVTIYDVAEVAGVSASTVSRVFSRPGRVSARMAQHVREVAERLGYHAELPMPALRRDSHLIALAVSDITNPAYSGIIRGVQAAAAERGHALILLDTQESAELEKEQLTQLLPSLGGVVLASPRVSDQQLRMLAKQVPLVLINRAAIGLAGVVPDNGRGVRRAVEHLASFGHTCIAYLAGPEDSWTDGIRWRAMREAALELELTVVRVASRAPTVSGGQAASEDVLNSRATAVIAFNDLMAIGLMHAYGAAGIRVPDRLSVVGFDNTMAAGLVTPALTTVGAPMLQLGGIAASNVIALAAGARWQHDGPITVPMRLVVRDSTGPLPRP